MRVQKLVELLNELSPFELQDEWDNSGLLVGDFSQDISKIALSIDVDEGLIDSLDENTLLITHHPIIFGGLMGIVGIRAGLTILISSGFSALLINAS